MPKPNDAPSPRLAEPGMRGRRSAEGWGEVLVPVRRTHPSNGLRTPSPNGAPSPRLVKPHGERAGVR